MAGKTPKLQQFALTPDQLFARQSLDLTEDEGYISHSDPIPIKMKMEHTRSMNSTLKSQEGLDPMFAMSF